MFDTAKEAIRTSSKESSVYIGCDSIRFRKNGQWYARYCTVVVLHKDSKHGCQLFHQTQNLPDYGNLKQRLMNEVNFAVSVALELLDFVGDRRMEIHLDINKNPKYKSNVAVKEALGYIRGTLGFEPIFKPDSWCATTAADHAVRDTSKYKYTH